MKPRLSCACFAAALIVLGGAGSALGDPVEGPNGHYYEVFSAPGISWDVANGMAQEMSWDCAQGHLATITSPEEDAFILGLIGDTGEHWAGGFQEPGLLPSSAEVLVAGTACPWLAGMPVDTLVNEYTPEPPDMAPAQSPAWAAICVEEGAIITWNASGIVGHPPVYGDQTGPDGSPGTLAYKQTGAEHGLSDVVAPHNALVGVFLGPGMPDPGATPAPLDFSSPESRDYLSLNPLLQQVFFMGDGLRSDLEPQAVVAPPGATRLFLGSTDGYGWANNVGAFDVSLQSSCGEPAGGWQWITGENWDYTNWGTGEPNDASGLGSEQHLGVGWWPADWDDPAWNDEGALGNIVGFVVEYEGVERPVAECVPTTNPSGKNIPKAGNNPRSGQNPDGFYELRATDNCSPEPMIYVGDTASDFVAGPFGSGQKVKITQAPGVEPKIKEIGGGIMHIQLKGDAIVIAVDAAGILSAPCDCRVPPPPK
ncbi:MAG TPA: hypothetical protein P5555_20695 [Candidatus Paceibacterota bacterium]|nr:hypothetical protein [Verrucomicrobiota bacterium]HOX01826.1 hypothetical protein [Verrucomicrobiota bacterium]HRZ47601.1 hypothetical protein [Candidatus Paceibacterota bacterium]HSA02678.1 hypothetical protein [Candidatus Paceibacterota bacterium]